MNREVFIQRLRDAMQYRGLNANALSVKAGAGRDYVRDLFRGRIEFPTVNKSRALANALDVDHEWLINGDGTPPWHTRSETDATREDLERLIDTKAGDDVERLRLIRIFVEALPEAGGRRRKRS